MINIWERVDAAAEARAFVATRGLDGTTLLDETGQYAARMGIPGVPFNVVVDSAGLVRDTGLSSPRELHQAVNSLPAGSLEIVVARHIFGRRCQEPRVG